MASSNTLKKGDDYKPKTVQIKRTKDFIGVTTGENHSAGGVYDNYIKLMPLPLPVVGVVSNTIVFKLPAWLTETVNAESSYTLDRSELEALKTYRLIDWQQNHDLVEIDKAKRRDGWLNQSKFLLISSAGEIVGVIADCSIERSPGGPSYPE